MLHIQGGDELVTEQAPTKSIGNRDTSGTSAKKQDNPTREDYFEDYAGLVAHDASNFVN